MKVIGIDARGAYICTVEHSEIEKVADKYYGKIETRLRAGDEFNLGAGYDFRASIKDACDKMKSADESFLRARGTLHAFASMVAQLPDSEDETVNGVPVVRAAA